MFDSIHNVNDFLSEHWLAEVFPSSLKTLTRQWKEWSEQGKSTPVKGLTAIAAGYIKDLGDLPEADETLAGRVTELHAVLLDAVGLKADPVIFETRQAETPIDLPLLARYPSATTTDSLHILQAYPVDNADALFGGGAELVEPLTI
ncbi:hypothetical protein, partial [Gordonia sp. 852002-10350_SCH5691597]|uniref:hypothetical protein n=1 Tax=Gordonia sp. 852002-10350_SCH5691597 TaxID=1834085 RepID=UPI000B1177FC